MRNPFMMIYRWWSMRKFEREYLIPAAKQIAADMERRTMEMGMFYMGETSCHTTR